MAEEAIKAKVTSVQANRGFFVSSSSEVDGSVTCSLTNWEPGQAKPPAVGDYVRLTQLRMSDRGWRAESGRPWQPSDQRRSSSGH